MRKLLALLVYVSLANGLYGQSLKLNKDAQFENNIHIEDNWPEGGHDYNYIFQYKVINNEGKFTILECKLVKAKMLDKEQKGGVVLFDTEFLRKNKFNSTQAFLQLAILNKPLKLVIGPNNKIISFSGVTEAINDAAIKWGLRADVANQLIQNSNQFPLTLISNVFIDLPNHNLNMGYEWKGENGHFNKVTAIDGALVHITSSEQPNNSTANATSTSLIILNKNTGLCEHMNTATLPEPKLSNSNLTSTHRYEQKLNYDEKLYKTDTAWINMAIKTNLYFGNSFAGNGAFDSTKVITYFKKHDKLFGNDSTYMVNKLALVQTALMQANYRTYGDLLLQTPTKYLSDRPTHLHNKLGEVLPTSVDSAYEICKYFVKHNGFKNWVHEELAQKFLPFDEKQFTEDEDFKKFVREKGITPDSVNRMMKKFTAERTNASRLLNRLHADNDPKLQQYVNALYLWADARQHDKDAGYLLKSGNKLLQMNDTYMHDGNGARYALLIYKLQLKAKMQQQADALLQKTIARLETFVADTSNTSRYAEQNILAYAWYLKYTTAKATDSVKALKYLSKAAQYSPKNDSEKAYTSFYDRVFLESKESYREAFVISLFKSGNNEEALKVFAQHITAEPESLAEMQKLYMQHFPQKSFKSFFATNILSTWPEAPSFTLKGLDGNIKTLNSFKNTWLVIDFWGTWCPPCRREMPDLNKFNNELNEGKHSGIKLLSVACRDKEENVRAYFADNQFNLLVVMSDTLIEKQYHIPYYPSKIIVSPGGKMLLLKFGDDWQTIVKSFNQL